MCSRAGEGRVQEGPGAEALGQRQPVPDQVRMSPDVMKDRGRKQRKLRLPHLQTEYVRFAMQDGLFKVNCRTGCEPTNFRVILSTLVAGFHLSSE